MRLREEELINIVGFVLCAIITIQLIRTLQTSDTPPPSAVPSVLSAITTCISWKCHWVRMSIFCWHFWWLCLDTFSIFPRTAHNWPCVLWTARATRLISTLSRSWWLIMLNPYRTQWDSVLFLSPFSICSAHYHRRSYWNVRYPRQSHPSLGMRSSSFTTC